MANESKSKHRGGRGRMRDPESMILDDLDLAILGVLPDEGEMIGKYLPKLAFVRDIRVQLDPDISSGSYGQRLGLMADAGYVKQSAARQTNASSGWQRTAKGRQIAENPK